jgi:hypothetical protein
VQLANYVCEVFGAQTTRHTVHAFTLCGADLRVWRFDRAGAVGSTIVNVNADPSRFIAAMLCYATMGGADVGFDPSFRWTTSDGIETVFDPTIHPINSTTEFSFICCAVRPDDHVEHELWIHPGTLPRRFAIKTRGGTCYKAEWAEDSNLPLSVWPLSVKDQWRTSDRSPFRSEIRHHRLDSRSSSGMAT